MWVNMDGFLLGYNNITAADKVLGHFIVGEGRFFSPFAYTWIFSDSTRGKEDVLG